DPPVFASAALGKTQKLTTPPQIAKRLPPRWPRGPLPRRHARAHPVVSPEALVRTSAHAIIESHASCVSVATRWPMPGMPQAGNAKNAAAIVTIERKPKTRLARE